MNVLSKRRSVRRASNDDNLGEPLQDAEREALAPRQSGTPNPLPFPLRSLSRWGRWVLGHRQKRTKQAAGGLERHRTLGKSTDIGRFIAPAGAERPQGASFNRRQRPARRAYALFLVAVASGAVLVVTGAALDDVSLTIGGAFMVGSGAVAIELVRVVL